MRKRTKLSVAQISPTFVRIFFDVWPFFLAWQNNNAGRKSLVSSLYCVLTNMTIRFSSRVLLGLGLTLLLLGMAQAQEASEVSR